MTDRISFLSADYGRLCLASVEKLRSLLLKDQG
jgi:hypothetical protein